jgi:hypothetical protein
VLPSPLQKSKSVKTQKSCLFSNHSKNDFIKYIKLIMSAYTPQQAWSVAYSDCDSILHLDSAFNKYRGEIKERAKILDKTLRMKIAAWIAKLSEEVRVWKSTRRVNNHSFEMFNCCQLPTQSTSFFIRRHDMKFSRRIETRMQSFY